MASQTRTRNCRKRRFDKVFEQDTNTCREIPANVLACQEVTKGGDFSKLFLPVRIEFAALILADQPGWFGDCAMKPVRIQLQWENMFHVSVLLLGLSIPVLLFWAIGMGST
jgi:hypothetical protein